MYKTSTNTAKKLFVLDYELCRFDSLLVDIQEHMPDDLKLYERIVNVRDALYRLKVQMHESEVTELRSSDSWFDDLAAVARLDDWFSGSSCDRRDSEGGV